LVHPAGSVNELGSRWSIAATSQIDRKRDDPEEKAAEDPFPRPVGELILTPVALVGVDGDPDNSGDLDGSEEQEHACPIGMAVLGP
jgi:hypothetical protein